MCIKVILDRRIENRKRKREAKSEQKHENAKTHAKGAVCDSDKGAKDTIGSYEADKLAKVVNGWSVAEAETQVVIGGNSTTLVVDVDKDDDDDAADDDDDDADEDDDDDGDNDDNNNDGDDGDDDDDADDDSTAHPTETKWMAIRCWVKCDVDGTPVLPFVCAGPLITTPMPGQCASCPRGRVQHSLDKYIKPGVCPALMPIKN